MTIVYDAGVLVAADAGQRTVWMDHRSRLEAGVVPVVTAPVVAQVSRSGRQALLRRFLRACDVVPMAPDDAHPVGALLARSRRSDVVDAHVALVASRLGATVVTGEESDLRHLAGHISPKPKVRPI